MPDISVPALNTNTIRTHLVRILHLRYKTACFPWKNEGSRTTLATHWTTHQGPRQRTRRRSTCRHGHAWIGRKAKAIGRNAKNPGKTRVFERRGQDSNNPQNPWENRSLKTRRRKIRRALQNTPCAACCMRALRLSLGH
jgi:hypothetical protein